MIRLGLFFYDHLYRRKLLEGSRAINLAKHAAGAALKPSFRHAFIYSDRHGDDSGSSLPTCSARKSMAPRSCPASAFSGPSEPGRVA